MSAVEPSSFWARNWPEVGADGLSVPVVTTRPESIPRTELSAWHPATDDEVREYENYWNLQHD